MGMRRYATLLTLGCLLAGCDRLRTRARGVPRPLVVQLSEDGAIRLSGAEVRLEELRLALHERALASPKNAEDGLPLLVVEISAHPECDYEHVQKVMYQCMREFIWRIRWRMGDNVLDASLPAHASVGMADERVPRGTLGSDELPEHPVIIHEEVELIDDFHEAEEVDADEVISPVRFGRSKVTITFGGGHLGYRHGQGRERCVARFGGSHRTESAVEAALRWLAKHQEPDGRWDGEEHEGDSTDPGITGLATLAFLGAGQTQNEGQYKETVRNAVSWMISQQNGEGCIGKGFKRGLGYHHAICGLALAEHYGLTRDERVGKAAQKAVWYSILDHQCEYSGWRYNPKQAADTSVTAWFVTQLVSAKNAGLCAGSGDRGERAPSDADTLRLSVDGPAFEGAINFLDTVTTKPGEEGHGGRVSYQPGREPGVVMTAVGMVCRQLMGWRQEDALLIGGAEWVVTRTPDWERANFYYWYYGSMAMFQMGGEYWKRWNAAMKDTLVPWQRRGGDEDGSWDPVGHWCSAGGRVMSTALGALCLETYYRYLPIYK